MKLEDEFDQVDMQARAELLWESGEYISTIEYYGHKVNLYLLKDFYVELFYQPDENKIVRIEKADFQSLGKFLNNVKL